MLNIYRIDRYLAEVQDCESIPVETGKVLLYGSSFLRNWGKERAKKQLSDATGGKLQVVNHGFGGSRVPELMYYYHRLVTPYQPSAFVLRTGINDIFGKVSPEECLRQTEQLVSWIRNDYPDAPIVFIEIFDTKRASEKYYALFAEYNMMLRALAAEAPNMYTIDLNPFFHEKAEDCGSPCGLRDVFLEDGLHLTDEAYADMAKYLAPQLQHLINGQ